MSDRRDKTAARASHDPAAIAPATIVDEWNIYRNEASNTLPLYMIHPQFHDASAGNVTIRRRMAKKLGIDYFGMYLTHEEFSELNNNTEVKANWKALQNLLERVADRRYLEYRTNREKSEEAIYPVQILQLPPDEEDDREEKTRSATTPVDDMKEPVVNEDHPEAILWKQHYTNREVMETYIKTKLTYRGGHDSDSTHHVKSLATLAIYNAQPEKFIEMYGRVYKWKTFVEMDNTEDQLSSLHANSILQNKSHTCSYVLQLKNNKDTWDNWIEVKQSSFTSAGLGVFAKKSFPLGSIVGYYCGKILWKRETCGGREPSAAFLKESGIEDSAHSLRYLNHEYKYVHVQPDSVSKFSPETKFPFYMGMHYINDACHDILETSPLHEKMKKFNNVRLLNDGSVEAVKQIKAGTELCCGYQLVSQPAVRQHVPRQPKMRKQISPCESLSSRMKREKQQKRHKKASQSASASKKKRIKKN